MNGESDFLSVLVKSGLVSPDEVAAALRRYEETGDDASLIDFFVLDGLLTPWQCEKICEGQHRGFFLDEFVFLARIHAKESVTSYLAKDTGDDSIVVLEVKKSRDATGGFTHRVTLRRSAHEGSWSVASEHDSS